VKIDNEFSVGVPIARAWEILNDIPTIAPCMPGAQLTSSDGDIHEGKVKIKVGPITSEYKGKATFIERDEAAGKMVIKGEGRDTRGAGNANADIHLQMTEAGDRTNISVNTDLKITGKVAQFGRGVIVDISEKLLGQFVDCLEQKIMTLEQDAAKIADAGADMGAAEGSVAGAAAATAGVAGAAGAMGIGRKVDGEAGEAAGADANPESYRTECFTGTEGEAVAADAAAGAVAGDASGAAASVKDAGGSMVDKAGDLAGGIGGGAVGGGAAAAVAGAGALAAGGMASAKGAMGGAKGAMGGAKDAVSGGTEEVEALDLMDLAGSALWKRFIPLIIVGVIALIVIIWLIAR